MALAIIANIILSAVVVTVIVGLLGRAIQTSRPQQQRVSADVTTLRHGQSVEDRQAA